MVHDTVLKVCASRDPLFLTRGLPFVFRAEDRRRVARYRKRVVMRGQRRKPERGERPHRNGRRVPRAGLQRTPWTN